MESTGFSLNSEAGAKALKGGCKRKLIERGKSVAPKKYREVICKRKWGKKLESVADAKALK